MTLAEHEQPGSFSCTVFPRRRFFFGRTPPVAPRFSSHVLSMCAWLLVAGCMALAMFLRFGQVRDSATTKKDLLHGMRKSLFFQGTSPPNVQRWQLVSFFLERFAFQLKHQNKAGWGAPNFEMYPSCVGAACLQRLHSAHLHAASWRDIVLYCQADGVDWIAGYFFELFFMLDAWMSSMGVVQARKLVNWHVSFNTIQKRSILLRHPHIFSFCVGTCWP